MLYIVATKKFPSYITSPILSTQNGYVEYFFCILEMKDSEVGIMLKVITVIVCLYAQTIELCKLN